MKPSPSVPRHGLAAAAQADFIGWTANVRAVSGGFLVNEGDALLNVYGGTVGQPSAGFIATSSAGGFLEGAGAQGAWLPRAARTGPRSTAS